MSQRRADIVVLGLGVGGEETAGRLAEAGLDVVGIEAELIGGECPYWGCIPSKMVIRAANLLAETSRVDGMAGRAHAISEWGIVAERIRSEATDDWDDTVAADRLAGKGVRIVRGRGRFVGPSEVDVDGDVYTASRGVVIAAGGTSVVPPIPGLADTPYWTNRDVLAAKELPDSLLVLGGGAVGVELAQALARFGVSVTIVEAEDRLLAAEEPETSTLVGDLFAKAGMNLELGVTAVSVSHDDDVFTVGLDDGREVRAERLLVAVGRRPRLDGLGIGAAGLDPESRHVDVDERMRAGDGLWAVGDITGRGAFTHMAMYQAGIAIADILGRDGTPADYRAVPRVTFTDPEIGAVGLTERQARDEGRAVAVGMASIPSTSRGWIHKAGNDGFIKLVADTKEGVLVGATAAAPSGGEVLGALVVAIQARVPVTALRHLIYAYPTFHRGILDALTDMN